jgi:hypothetical protein
LECRSGAEYGLVSYCARVEPLVSAGEVAAGALVKVAVAGNGAGRPC